MNIFAEILSIFNNREIAFLFWIGIIVLAIFFSKLRKTHLPVIFHIITNKIMLILFIIIGTYLFVVIQFFRLLGVWENAYLKDVLFWLFSVGFILVFKINEAKNNSFFKSVFISAFIWTIILEFVVNLYSFCLIVELVILPLLTFIVTIQAVAELDEKHKVVSNLFQYVIALFGFSIFSYSLYKTILNFEDVFNFQTIAMFLLPTTLTILFIPLIYLLALYSSYESYFTRLDFMTIKSDKVKKSKKYIFKTAKFNLNKLSRIKNNFDKRVFYDDTDLKEYVRAISKKSKDSN